MGVITRAVAVTVLPAVMIHEGSQIQCDHLVTVIRLLQALMLLMVISSLPNFITTWYSAL
jgi:Zn-dependent protease with chaperone function